MKKKSLKAISCLWARQPHPEFTVVRSGYTCQKVLSARSINVPPHTPPAALYPYHNTRPAKLPLRICINSHT